MAEDQQHVQVTGTPGKRRRVRFSTEIMFILSVVFCVALSIIYLSRYSTIRTLLLKENELNVKIETLERENRRLKQNLDTLSTPEGIERLARERLGLVRPEEIVVSAVPSSSSAEIRTGSETEPSDPKH
ncbi:MAG TPA: cell division protein FtsL [Candidatus Ozemobacteraceae bacterium]|nr:cell division protein FtsL [Candidatus Ozemobacteraceae bacterium]